MPLLRRYAELLVQWNRSASNLFSKNDEDRIVGRHLVESIATAAWLRDSGARQWLDFGSGAGFPAIPLAILGVGESWTLVESRRPKTLFMRKAIEEIGLQRIEVIHGRLEVLAGIDLSEGQFDGFTSRATLRLAPTLDLAQRVLRQGSVAFLWKGSGRAQEWQAAGQASQQWRLEEERELGGGQVAVMKLILIR